MVNNKKMTTKEEYRAAVLEVINFSGEDIVTASGAGVVYDDAGDNLIGGDNANDIYWW